MSDWTPDTDHIREIYSQDATSEDHRKVYETEFDRWLQTIKAQAWQDGHDTALINGQSENPHQNVTGSSQAGE